MLVVFSDLDGTLLDHHTYSHAAAGPAIEALAQRGWPLVLCSSKTRAEMTPLQAELGLVQPMICENGGGIFAPRGHEVCEVGGGWQAGPKGWMLWPLGMDYADLRQRFGRFQDRFAARGFGDMSDAEVAQLTGLDLARAGLARQREFNEPLVLPDPEQQETGFMAAAQAEGLQVTRGGRFYHLLGGGDKGRAVQVLAGLFKRLHPGIITAALGDAPNDAPMLAVVDHSFLVARPDGSHAVLGVPGLVRQEQPGPEGFNQAVLGLLAELG